MSGWQWERRPVASSKSGIPILRLFWVTAPFLGFVKCHPISQKQNKLILYRANGWNNWPYPLCLRFWYILSGFQVPQSRGPYLSYDLPGDATGKGPTWQRRRPKRCRFNQSLGWEIPWRRTWQLTPVFLPRQSHGQRSLAGSSPWSHQESDTTEYTHTCIFHIYPGALLIAGI